MEDDDASLVKSVLSGNLDDFKILVEKYQHLAERWAFHRTRNLTDAENIAQEAFIEVYLRLDTLREPHKFSSWLQSIVNNTSISWFRRKRQTESFEQMSINDGSLFTQFTSYETSKPDDLIEQQESDNLLQTALTKLPHIYQRVITMFYFDDLSHKEIADSLNLSVSAIKSILHRARKSLRKEMRKND